MIDKKPKLSEQVFLRLRDRVLNNQLRVGNYYLEQELAAELGISRTPLREAAIRLEQEGLVKIVPRRGIFIRPVLADEMREIYDILSCLEVAALSAACRSPIPKEPMEELERVNRDMKEALATDDLARWALNDKRFHQILIELSHNRELIRLVNGYWDKTDRVRNMTLRLRKPPAQSTEEHRQVIAALKAGDAQRTIDIHSRHRRRASDELTQLLDVLDHSY
ncbi:GntR family transcriptional regulator [Aestuariirhabdus sp. Z084]|uniref:GntR family transcriptional regulator n=1 Tax=Aestuariirhabdus haliotis TaxID=2918751 RepID=UPI00201B398D|nr:GntR family transcriptional regulator [Aestuariirhabdus haliotis]MCL6416506.1 GntR family transcriptional regulator [Aestuariirhabdus haliotis]MCL6420496.1 GntR family transcriptional regulator [Aestuariirhabdus haliotis]